MLIFFLDLDPSKAAAFVPNGHMKLAVECGQILRAAMWFHNGAQGRKPGYANHPHTVWVRESSWAWDWVLAFAKALSCHEYPTRYAENQKKRERPFHGAWYTIKENIVKPKTFLYQTMEETPFCPLPKECPKDECLSHEARAIQFRIYHVLFKNKDDKHFLFEPRARRPFYLPCRTMEQELLVQQDVKRLKKCN